MPDEVVIDPYVERILKARGESAESMKKILTPDEPESEEEPIIFSMTAPGDGAPAPREEKELTDEEKAAKQKEIDDKAAADTAAAIAAAAANETPEQKAIREAKEKEEKDKLEAATKAATTPVRPIVVQKKAEPAKPDETADAKKVREEEETYINGLTEDQKDELALARFAEKKGKAGLAKKTLDYYKKLDQFAIDNPEAEPDGDEFKKFKEENEPKLTGSERRRLEREMITEVATANALVEAEKKYAPVVSKLNDMETAPLIRQVESDVESKLAVKPATGEAISAEVVKKILSLPYAQAAEEFPIEAQIVVGSVAAAREWTKIWLGSTAINLDNPTHQWLMSFIAIQERKMQARPAAEQVRDGKKFLPIGQFVTLEKSDPALARQYYSFDDKSLVDLISQNGVEQYNVQVKKFAKYGTDKKADAADKSAATTTTTGSPKATTHISTGAAADAAKMKVNDAPHLSGIMKLSGG